MGKVEYTTENGYRGVLWGRMNMTILDSIGNLVFNTNCRPTNVNTLAELKSYMEMFCKREHKTMLCVEMG